MKAQPLDFFGGCNPPHVRRQAALFFDAALAANEHCRVLNPAVGVPFATGVDPDNKRETQWPATKRTFVVVYTRCPMVPSAPNDHFGSLSFEKGRRHLRRRSSAHASERHFIVEIARHRRVHYR